MGAGRKNLKREAEEESITLGEGQSVMQVVSLRGSNIIEVMDDKSEKSLARFPATFQNNLFVKRGSFVVIDVSGREDAEKSGSKVACTLSRVLFYKQVRQLQKSQQWPEAFKSGDNWSTSVEQLTSQQDVDDDNSSDDDSLPPLERNTNRTMPFEMQASSESESESDY